MPQSDPYGKSPLRAGVVPGSQASGKVVSGDAGTEVSQVAVSVLTPHPIEGKLNRYYI